MTTTELTGAEDVAWDLSDLYESGDDARLEQDVQEAEEASETFRETYYGKVADLDAAGLAAAIAERERIESIFTRAIYYAHLWFSTDTADPARGALVARLTEKGAALDTQLLFFGLEIADLDDDRADALIADSALEHWQHWLRSLRKFRPYLLSEPEEKIFTEKSVSGVSAWSRLHEELLSAVKVEIDGEEISFEKAMSKLYSADRDERRSAAEAVTEALAPGLRTRTFVFNTILVDKSIDDRLRGYETWISSRNLRNDTTDEAVRALVDAAVSRYDVPQRYYRLKAKLVGLDRLTFYDRFAPIGDDPTSVSWDEARDIVLAGYHDFAPEAGDIVERFFTESWIDAPTRENKRTGAFCATSVPGVHPYILMNFTGDRRSILTLAHELGHGLHGSLAAAARALQCRHSADDRRDRLGLRRGAHLQASARPRGRSAPPPEPAGGADRGLDRDGVPPDRDESLRGGRAHGAARAGRGRDRPVRGALARHAEADVRRLGRHRRVRDLVELHPALPLDTGLRVRVRLRLPLRARDLPSLRAGGRVDGGAVPRRPSRGRIEAARGARGDRRARSHRSRDLGERHRRARRRARRGRGARDRRSAWRRARASVGGGSAVPSAADRQELGGEKGGVCAKAHCVRSRPRSGPRAHGARCARWGGADTRRHGQADRHRRDVPAHRPGGGVRADPARHEGVLQLHQRAARARTGSAASWAARSSGSTTTTATTPRTRFS